MVAWCVWRIVCADFVSPFTSSPTRPAYCATDVVKRRQSKKKNHELEEYHRWCEVLASWLALVDDAYVTELREAILLDREIRQTALPAQVASRSARLYYYLQQSLQKFDRGMELVRSTSMRQGQAACGYECMRQLHSTFSVVSRMEAIAVRDVALALYTKAGHCKRPLEVVRFLEDELGKCDMKLHRFPELKLGTSDRHTILLQSVSAECRQYLLLHGRSDTWENLVASIKFYEEQTRLCDPHSKLHAVGDGKGQQGKGLCWTCGKSGHFAADCPKAQKKAKGDGKKGKPSGEDGGKGGKKGDKGGKPKSKAKAKAKPKAKGKGKARAAGEEDSEQVMALSGSLRAATNEPNASSSSSEPLKPFEAGRLSMSDAEVEKLRQSSSSRISHYAWLVDSGATCHILSAEALQFYEVVREHTGSLPTLSDAQNNTIETVKLVDLRIKFGAGADRFAIGRCGANWF